MNLSYGETFVNELPGSIREMYHGKGIELSEGDYKNILFNILNQPGIMVTDKLYGYGCKRALYPASVWRVQDQLFQFLECLDIGGKLNLTQPHIQEIYKSFCQLVISSNPESKFAKQLIREYDVPGLNLNDSFAKARRMLEQSLEPTKYSKHRYILLAMDEWIFGNNFTTLYPVFRDNLMLTLKHNPMADILHPLLDSLTSYKPTPYNTTNDLMVRQFTRYVNKKVNNDAGVHVVFKSLEKVQENTPYLPIVKTLTSILASRLYELEGRRV